MSFRSQPSDLIIPVGSTILVTGASGFIASHIIHEALSAGYKVRGTARTEEKAARTRKTHSKFSESYNTVIVEDMQHADAFTSAVKDVDAIIHTANVMTFSDDPAEVVEPCVKGVKSILEAALNEKRIKRFVYTSSSTAATLPKPGKEFDITPESWNTEVEQEFGNAKGKQKGKNFEIYALSKTAAERALWAFVSEKKPSFVVNTVLPNANLGRILDEQSIGATGQLCLDVLAGKRPTLGPQYMINVTDCARLHVIAAIDKDVHDQRILAFDQPFNVNKVAEVVQEITGKKTLEADPEEGEDLSKVDNGPGRLLLRKWWGQEYQGLVESVKQNIEGKY